MTLRDIVKELRDRGHSVVYKKRSDGSIAVLSIDSERFTAASRAGNRRARQMVGQTISKSLSTKRKAAGVKGGIARGAQRTAAAKVKVKRVTKAQRQEEREYQRLRRIAKKHGLKAIGKKQIKAAKKRGEKWKDIRKSIIKTYRSRYSRTANMNTRQGVAIYIRDHGLSERIPEILEDESIDIMAMDLQELKEAAYDAVENGSPFSESYWINRLLKSAEDAKGFAEEARAFEKELRRKPK